MYQMQINMKTIPLFLMLSRLAAAFQEIQSLYHHRLSQLFHIYAPLQISNKSTSNQALIDFILAKVLFQTKCCDIKASLNFTAVYVYLVCWGGRVGITTVRDECALLMGTTCILGPGSWTGIKTYDQKTHKMV